VIEINIFQIALIEFCALRRKIRSFYPNNKRPRWYLRKYGSPRRMPKRRICVKSWSWLLDCLLPFRRGRVSMCRAKCGQAGVFRVYCHFVASSSKEGRNLRRFFLIYLFQNALSGIPKFSRNLSGKRCRLNYQTLHCSGMSTARRNRRAVILNIKTISSSTTGFRKFVHDFRQMLGKCNQTYQPSASNSYRNR